MGERLAVRPASQPVLILSDSNVQRLHGAAFADWPCLVLPPGEAGKTLAQAERVYRALYAAGHDKRSLLVGIGGGAVTDLCGFVAATYQRGLGCGLVPTTLLAQVDAAIGGKNAVNLDLAKNLVGTIRQPDFIIIDPAFNRTLPLAELQSGLGELVKYAILAGGGLASRVEAFAASLATAARTQHSAQPWAALADEPLATRLAALVREAAGYKAAVVMADEHEQGRRRLLNLGHTLGHALELSEGLSHGLAVIKGLYFSLRYSSHLGFLPPEAAARLESSLAATGVDASYSTPADTICDLVGHDKKKAGHSLDFVFVAGPGQVFSQAVELDRLRAFLRSDRP